MKQSSPDLDVKRRRWAEEQIAAFQNQIQGLERRVAELKAFLNLLSSTAESLNGGDRRAELPPGGAGETLGALLAKVLHGSGSRALGVKDIVPKLSALGYTTTAKTELSKKVRAELQRQVQKGHHGIVRTKRGRYTVRG